ncbi:hypothetical protein CsSME_00008462 [Camellia sinensis var. sinensis]|uniref:Uncharacterized protein n=1 Tax=Camellia sinensis TaxID=4442 RepID=A0A7J7HUX0_CAMSI|nr:uncharacterized protein LOC114309566 [Camellia sinensis]KAF5956662.1 hypothetical protein HYC85_003887 [Camellia sinensis]
MGECCLELLGFVGILKESIKLLLQSKNGKLIATITTISILLNSLLSSFFILFTRPFIGDLLAKQALLYLPTQNSSDTDPSDMFVDIKHDIRILLVVEFASFLASFTVSLFSISSMILASAVTYYGKSLSFKDLLSRFFKLFVRPLVTFLQFKLTVISYIIVFVLALMFLLAIIYTDHLFTFILINIALFVLTSIFWIYFSVFWSLAMVISVIEESCYGIQALRKASRLIKDRRLQGFALNFVFVLPMVIVFMVTMMIGDRKSSLSTQIVMVLVMTVFSSLVMVFQWISLTVLYFQCKKTHGEAIESQGSIEEYSRVLSSTPLLKEDIPQEYKL